MYEGACNADDYVNDDDEAMARVQALEDGDEPMEAETSATEEREETMEDRSSAPTPSTSASFPLPSTSTGFQVNSLAITSQECQLSESNTEFGLSRLSCFSLPLMPQLACSIQPGALTLAGVCIWLPKLLMNF